MNQATAKAEVRRLLAARIRALRQEAGLSISQLARLLGQSRPTYYKTEEGQRDVAPDELIALAEIFAVEVGWLLGIDPLAAPEGEGRDQTPSGKAKPDRASAATEGRRPPARLTGLAAS
jgi:transcriptional regulator with XRE-family HTH domain